MSLLDAYGIQNVEKDIPEARRPVQSANLAILRVSKRINEEALHVGLIKMPKCFFDSQAFDTAIQAQAGSAANFHFNTQYPNRVSHLSKTELSLTNKGFFRFFDIAAYPRAYASDTPCLGPKLQNILGLQELLLRFRSLEDGWDGSPWGNGASSPYPRAYDYVCCQRVVVDWIWT